MVYCMCVPAVWSTSARNPGKGNSGHMQLCSSIIKKHTQSVTLPRRQDNGVNNAGGVVGAHMLSSKDGNRVKGTVSPGGREREIKVHSLMLDTV